MEIKVVNAGNCMICGKPIKLAVPIGHDKLPNIFFCKKCESELLEYDRKRPERDDENEFFNHKTRITKKDSKNVSI